MPLYTYVCDVCGREREHLVRYSERDHTLLCSCGGREKRRGLETFTMGKPAYQMAGITADGTHVPGHFGRDAARHRKKKKA